MQKASGQNTHTDRGEMDDKAIEQLANRLVQDVWRHVEQYTDGQIWLDTLKANEAVASELRSALAEAPDVAVLFFGATCGKCGFQYREYKGHIIPCPRCATEAGE